MLRSSFAYSTLWRPFDRKYDDLLQRWRQHRDLIDLEMSVSAKVDQFEANSRIDALLSKFEEDFGQPLGQRDIGESLVACYRSAKLSNI